MFFSMEPQASLLVLQGFIISHKFFSECYYCTVLYISIPSYVFFRETKENQILNKVWKTLKLILLNLNSLTYQSFGKIYNKNIHVNYFCSKQINSLGI